jgi:exosortase family protein XrtF
MSAILRNPLWRFLLAIFGFYIAWFLFYTFLLKPSGKVDLFIIDVTIRMSTAILETFGYRVFTGEERLIGIDGTGGLWIGDNCDGLFLFAVFTGFIVAYPGSWKHKLWYIPVGIVILQLLNVCRVVGLAILDTKSRAWTEFNHTYTFNLLIYGCIFLMWMHWVNRYSSNILKS